MSTMIEQDTYTDYDELAHEYCQKYLFNSIVKREVWPECGFGEYESIIAEYERRIEKNPKIPGEKIKEIIKMDDRIKHLFEDDEELERPETCPELPDHIRVSQEMKNTFSQSEAYQLMQIYIQWSRDVSPRGYKDFHPYCFLWLLSVIAARRVYFQLGVQQVYTNLRVALCAGSTGFKKSTTVKVAIYLLEKELGLRHLLINTPKITPEALISKMTGRRIPADYEDLPSDKQEEVKVKLAWSAQKALFSDEFGMFLKKMIQTNSAYSGFIDLLLQELEDCSPIGKDTIARQEEIVEKPYFPSIGSIVPKTMTSAARAGSELWETGLLPRMLPVCLPDGERNTDRVEIRNKSAPSQLILALQEWHDKLGFPVVDIVEKETGDDSKKTKKWIVEQVEELPEYQCTWTEPAKKRWYEYGWTLEDLSQEQGFPEDLKAHYGGRLATNLLRVAMLIASLDYRHTPNNIVISDLHMAIAQELIEIARQGLHRFYEQVNGYKSQQSKTESEVMQAIKRKAERAKTEKQKWISPAQIRSELNEKYSTEEIIKVLKPQIGNTLEYQPPKRSDSAGAYRLLPK